MREIESQAPVPTAKAAPRAVPASTPGAMSISTGQRRPGRPANVEETPRRVAMLERVRSGESTNAEAAAELGLSYGAWAGWKTQYAKRVGGIASVPRVRASEALSPIPASKRGRGRPSDPVETARRT